MIYELREVAQQDAGERQVGKLSHQPLVMVGLSPGCDQRQEGGVKRGRLDLGTKVITVEINELIRVDRL